MNDIKNKIRGLQLACKIVKYKADLNINEIGHGSPKDYLRLYHYLFMDYNAAIAADILNNHQMELNSKNDKLFIDGIYKLSRDMFGYVPKLTKDQFFQNGYACAKAQMAIDIVDLIRKKADQLQPSSANTIQTIQSSLSQSTKQSTIGSSFNTNLKDNIKDNSEMVMVIQQQQTSQESEKTKAGQRQLKNSNTVVQNHSSTIKLPARSQSVKRSASYVSNNNGTVYLNRKQVEHDADSLSSENTNSTASSASLHESMKIIISESMKNLCEKIESLGTRIEAIEQTVENNHAEEATVSVKSVPLDTNTSAGLAKSIENLSARLTLVETDNMIMKQNFKNISQMLTTINATLQQITTQQASTSNQNDCTTYETPFNSFLNISAGNQTLNDEPVLITKKSSRASTSNRNSTVASTQIAQGLAYDLEEVNTLGKLNDLSLNSNDSTPTYSYITNDNDGLSRAEQLVRSASNLKQSLISNHLKF